MRNNFLLIHIFFQLDKMVEKKKAAMKEEADLGFTVIRVESSVSQLAEEEEEEEADTEEDEEGEEDEEDHQQEVLAGVTSAGRLEEDEQEEEAVSVATETETETEPDSR